VQTRTSKAAIGPGQRAFPCSIRSSAPGFTLLELLAVLAIIAVLTSLLTTALNQTKSKGQQLSCLNNLRQLQISWFLYVDENEDQLPLNQTDFSATSPNNLAGKSNSTNSWVAGNPKTDTTTDNHKRGTLFPLTKSVGVYRCPADDSTVLNRGDLLRTRSFAMSAYLNGDNVGLDPRVKTRYSELISPSPDEVFVFIEEHPDSIWGAGFSVQPKEKYSLSSGSWSSTPADRHKQGCNLSFADGHIEYWRWLAPKRYDLQNRPTTSGAELKDLRRLQDAVPQP
jgi:prepilin-type N-terminal cleavage/methylation domain-containing protein/prepilin-type processing-associated H-X9-DG protein